MGKHRILRIASRRDRVIRIREIWPTEDSPFTGEEEAVLDTGAHLVTDEGRVVDLNAYYEASEAERNARALDLVS